MTPDERAGLISLLCFVAGFCLTYYVRRRP